MITQRYVLFRDGVKINEFSNLKNCRKCLKKEKKKNFGKYVIEFQMTTN